MEFKQAQKQARLLKAKLTKWAHEYYDNDHPSVDDAEYDACMRALKTLEQQFPALVDAQSLTQQVGGHVSEKFTKHQHQYPMLSLNDVFDWQDIQNFNKQVSKVTGVNNNTYTAELKIDGLSISLIYNNGVLVSGATRGDGMVGENVTANIKQIKSIPHTIPCTDLIEIRGEVFLSKQEFNKLNTERLQFNQPLFANPRNAAAGTLRQLDSTIVAARNLDAFLYYYFNEKTPELTQYDAIQKIESLGFKINPETKLCVNLADVQDYITHYTQVRSSLAYEIDGIVLKLNSKHDQELLGYTAKSPKWAVAYKFPAEIKTTQLLDIYCSVGRTGKITYNAKLATVEIAGTNVSAASLNNAPYILAKNLRVGAWVKVKKAGDIIPEVISLVQDQTIDNFPVWKPATHCPVCQSVLEKAPQEVDQFCVNFTCPAQIKRSLEHFASRTAMNIVGLGYSTIDKFYDEGIIRNVADIFKLSKHEEKIINLDKMGSKSFMNLINSIEVAKKNSFEKVLFGLGIRHIGAKTAKTIAEIYRDIDQLCVASFDELSEIASIGEVLACSLVDWFKIPANQALITSLKQLGVNFTYLGAKKHLNSSMNNKIFVITGTLSQSREVFKTIIENNNGKVTDSVSRRTDFVLAGENGGSKIIKAQQYNIPIIDEQTFHAMLTKEHNE